MKKLLLILLPLLFIGAIGCQPMGPNLGLYHPTPTETTPINNKVTYFSDSLGAMSRGYCPTDAPPDCALMRELWDQHPEYSISDDTMVGGTLFQDWHEAMANVEQGTTVVLELGTNNALNETWMVTQQHILETLQIMREAGITRVIWFTLDEPGARLKNATSPHFLSRVQWQNNYMRELLASDDYDDIGLEIFDWNSIAQSYFDDNITILSSDNLHHNYGGMMIYAEVLVDAVLYQEAA